MVTQQRLRGTSEITGIPTFSGDVEDMEQLSVQEFVDRFTLVTRAASMPDRQRALSLPLYI